jgi:hypothetical protein
LSNDSSAVRNKSEEKREVVKKRSDNLILDNEGLEADDDQQKRDISSVPSYQEIVNKLRNEKGEDLEDFT